MNQTEIFRGKKLCCVTTLFALNSSQGTRGKRNCSAKHASRCDTFACTSCVHMFDNGRGKSLDFEGSMPATEGRRETRAGTVRRRCVVSDRSHGCLACCCEGCRYCGFERVDATRGARKWRWEGTQWERQGGGDTDHSESGRVTFGLHFGVLKHCRVHVLSCVFVPGHCSFMKCADAMRCNEGIIRQPMLQKTENMIFVVREFMQSECRADFP